MKRLLLALYLVGCSSEAVSAGYEEPVRVFNGQFHEGALPGLPPLGADDIAAGVEPLSPRVTTVDGIGGILRFGDPRQAIRGRASSNAVAVAFRFEDVGSGYWIEPVRGPDALNAGEFTWSFEAQFSRALPLGRHRLLFAAVDAQGHAGTQLDVALCAGSEIPDNQNVCLPTQKPPALVISLAWDVDADVDLQVRTPDGTLVDAKHPLAKPVDGEPTPADGRLDLDSNAACSIDGVRRENLVFDQAAASGEYAVYANLFAGCGKPSTRFTLTVHMPAEGSEPGTFKQVEVFRNSGILLASQANGGAKLGLFVSNFIVP
ncbi:MAG: hypothetical protein ACOY0T_30335 [Myxococcota bacterium]